MLYYTTNRPKWISVQRLDSVISFAIDYLSLAEEILLHIRFSDSLSQLGLFEGKEDDEYFILINRTISERDIIETIFHELTHLEQAHSGKFDPDRRTWNSQRYNDEYLSLPWEKDAYYHEEIMSQEFFKKDIKNGIRS